MVYPSSPKTFFAAGHGARRIFSRYGIINNHFFLSPIRNPSYTPKIFKELFLSKKPGKYSLYIKKSAQHLPL